uniref:Large ribosomal subunit protein bL33m n=1 Tax=Kwoniella bestiolae CBS 10118 TaxID=1296100 RepID=A0A1B9G4F7_9TREE|nr:50S small subunit ribosomal protein L33 [Kwoniella bestiolae CBS 10118]OCF25915.1 50S small subunit ribosomal protein L33 [Kwoniella bestiolae CBS 10118]
MAPKAKQRSPSPSPYLLLLQVVAPTAKWNEMNRKNRLGQSENDCKLINAGLYRRILVKLVSTALTGYFYTTSRIRVSDKLAKIKYDPIGGHFTHTLSSR